MCRRSSHVPDPFDAIAAARTESSSPVRTESSSTSGSTVGETETIAPPPELSAQGLHELALEAFRVGNRGRLTLCDALRILGETRMYLELGFPSLAAYAGAFFHLGRAEAFEYVRVASRLVELTELREAFGRGRIGWSVLKAITRVASVTSQSSWLDFVGRHGVERTLAEARDALRRGRNRPRESSFGLPNLDQRLVLTFPRSDMEKIRTWIQDACATVAEKTGTHEVSLEQAILFLCERDMISLRAAPSKRDRSGPGKATADGDGEVSYRAQIVYQHCPGCSKARVGTRDGFVEVAAAEIERYEASAEPVAIDGPTPPKLRRKILAREGRRCANPRCHNRADHCHHLKFRSRGGKTELANEVAVCSTCHALVHAGLLRVSGDPNVELLWVAVASPESIARDLAPRRAVADRLPVLQMARPAAGRKGSRGTNSESADAGSAVSGNEPTDTTSQSANADWAGSGDGRPDTTSESADADWPASRDGRPDTFSESAGADWAAPGYRRLVSGPALDFEELAGGLARLGVPARRCRRLIAAAVEALPRAEITEANVLRRAIASM